MPVSGTPSAAAVRLHPAKIAYEALTAVSMTVGRGPAARAMADLAMIEPTIDQLIQHGLLLGTEPLAITGAGRRQLQRALRRRF